VIQHALDHNPDRDNDWDAHSPPNLGRTLQDDFTRKLLARGYSSKSAQYGVVDAFITGSGQATACPAPGPVFDSTALWSRILCETHRPPAYSANGTDINHWQVYAPATRA
jgi:hypothetical protein